MRIDQFTHWIFDLDGTLTRPIFNFVEIKQRLGLPHDRGILEVLQELPKEQALTISQQLEAIEYELAGKAEIASGAHALLNWLSQRGVPIGILTRNLKSHAVHTLEVTGLAGFFEHSYILGREEAAHKPDPEGILYLLGLWGANPANTVMVGDYLFDLQAGEAAGTATIYVDGSGAFIHRRHARASFRNLDEVLEFGRNQSLQSEVNPVV